MEPEPEPLYYSRAQLAERAGVSTRSLDEHYNANTGNLHAAREVHKCIGIVYVAHKCRKYLALIATTKTRRKQKQPA